MTIYKLVFLITSLIIFIIFILRVNDIARTIMGNAIRFRTNSLINDYIKKKRRTIYR